MIVRWAILLLLVSQAVAPCAHAQDKTDAPPDPAAQWMRSLTLDEKIAQLMMVQFFGDSPNPRSRSYAEFRSLVTDVRIGGFIVLNRVRAGFAQNAEPHAMATFLNRMQKLSRLPLLVGGDFERGASMRIAGATRFPQSMAFGAAGDVALTRELGRLTAREARAIGVHWVFAPVADVNNNPDNPVINIRSFGEDPETVAAHVRAYIEGAHSSAPPVLVTVKHFPGHGDTATDSHLGMGTVTASRDRLNRVELVPFRAAIAAGVDSVMTAHLSVPALEPEPIPATVSRNVLTGLLREELQFKGLVTTDAMDMKGLTSMFPAGEAAVRAIEAGADLLLIPADPRQAVSAVAAAVRSGRISAKRIDNSLRRVLAAKVRLGLHRSRTVDLEAISDSLDTPEDQQLAAAVAGRALTLVRNRNGLLPLKQPGAACFYLMSAGRTSTQGREVEEALQDAAPGAQVEILDPRLPKVEFDRLAAEASKCDTIVAAAYVLASSYSGGASLQGNYPDFLTSLLATRKPVAFIAFGNPYLLRSFPDVDAYLAAYTTVESAERAVVDALLGRIPVTGRLPITIPGLARLGDGLTLQPSNPRPAARADQ